MHPLHVAVLAGVLASCAGPSPGAASREPRPVVAVSAAPTATSGTPRPGGLRMVYGVSPRTATRATAEAVAERLRRLGMSRIDVAVSSPDEIAVEVRRAFTPEEFTAVRAVVERPGRFAIARCDDDADPIGAQRSGPLPAGVVIKEETVPTGPGQRVARHFASAFARPGETEERVVERLRSWLAGVAGSSGQRFAVGRLEGGEEPGFRSYTLHPEDELDGGAVAEVQAVDGPTRASTNLEVRFTPDGSRVFAALTATNLQRRLAIVVDGRVFSAPVVMEAIVGGRVVVTLGRDVSRAEAEGFADLLEAGPLPGRLELRVEELIDPSE